MSKTKLSILDGVATISLCQPEKRNAFNDHVIAELIEHLDTVAGSSDARILVLEAEGKHFCAGADLAWMKSMAKLNYDENLADARNLATLMAKLNNMPLPSVACVQGAAYGGAIGLIACCDIALSSEEASFCLSEVKLGLAPATIGPYVVAAMGARRCRQLFMTAKVFNANEALQYGLVHEVCKIDELYDLKNKTIRQLLSAGPNAVIEAKTLINTIQESPDDLIEQTSQLIAKLRVSDEGQEGLSAFFEKRPPNWQER